jgi:hypothetical protein
MSKRNMLLVAVILAISILLAACASAASTEGPPGPAGPAGPEGPQGPPGAAPAPSSSNPVSGSPAQYVGDQVCAGCHPDIYKIYMKSGHPWSLTPVVGGENPAYPFTQVPGVPNGYSWNDVSYVIGGYNWKTLFTDHNGYIITDALNKTGDTGYLNQWNFANELVGKNAAWVGYKSGEQNVLFTCGGCHTTGYTLSGNQDGKPGLIGTWNQPGVRCEACHAPGSQHVSDPQNIEMPINRSADLCRECHSNADLDTVDPVDEANLPHPPAEAIYRGKHMVLECVDCHDPHSGVVQSRMEDQPVTTTACTECHYQEAEHQKNEMHQQMNLACTECHLPRLVQAAWGDPAHFIGDIHSHQVAIDPSRFDQFVTTGDTKTYVIAPTGLNYACRQCHNGIRALAKTDEELQAMATGYHNQP